VLQREKEREREREIDRESKNFEFNLILFCFNILHPRLLDDYRVYSHYILMLLSNSGFSAPREFVAATSDVE